MSSTLLSPKRVKSRDVGTDWESNAMSIAVSTYASQERFDPDMEDSFHDYEFSATHTRPRQRGRAQIRGCVKLHQEKKPQVTNPRTRCAFGQSYLFGFRSISLFVRSQVSFACRRTRLLSRVVLATKPILLVAFMPIRDAKNGEQLHP